MNPTTPFVTTVAVLALLGAPAAEAQPLAAAPAPAAASAPASPGGAPPNGEVGARLARALASPEAAVRRGALEATLLYARYNAGGLDLSATAPPLLAIYAADPEEACRLAAVVALHAIGDEAAMAVVRRLLGGQASRAVRVASLGALVDHYGLGALAGAADLAALAEALLAGREAAAAPVVATNR